MAAAFSFPSFLFVDRAVAVIDSARPPPAPPRPYTSSQASAASPRHPQRSSPPRIGRLPLVGTPSSAAAPLAFNGLQVATLQPSTCHRRSSCAIAKLQLQPFAKGRALRCASLAASSADGAEPVRRNVCHILEPTTPSTACTLQASPPLDAAPALISFVSCCTLVVVGGWLPSGDRGMVQAESAAPPPAPPPVLPFLSCVRISASPRLSE